MWFWFWVFAIIVVAALLCWVRFSEFRVWCKRVFSRVAPDMGGLWKTISAFCGQGWVQLAAIPIVIGLVWGAVELVKDSGRNEVRVEVAEQNAVNGEVRSTSSGTTLTAARNLYHCLGLHVEHLRSQSQPALLELIGAKQRFDMIYIDGLHAGLTPTIDFALSMCLLAEDGILILDDWPWPDVIGLKNLCDRHMEKLAECPDIVAYRAKPPVPRVNL